MCVSVLLVFDEFELRADKQVAKCLVVLLEYGKLQTRRTRLGVSYGNDKCPVMSMQYAFKMTDFQW